MKTLKFRFYDKTEKKMKFIDGIFNMPQPDYDFDEIQQFTGLSDKLGQEIYEGDILQTTRGNVKVKYYNSYACFGILGKMHYAMIPISRIIYESPQFFNSSLIVGNIYTNPDLLK